MSETNNRCPKCKNKLLQKSGTTTRVRIDHPVYFDKDGTCFARCHWCKAEVEIPVELREGVSVQNERFVLSKTDAKA